MAAKDVADVCVKGCRAGVEFDMMVSNTAAIKVSCISARSCAMGACPSNADPSWFPTGASLLLIRASFSVMHPPPYRIWKAYHTDELG